MNVKTQKIQRFKNGVFQEADDLIVVEEPLEIRLEYGEAAFRKEISLSVTMRTPNHDVELAAGFLFSEGLIFSKNDILSIRHCLQTKPEAKGNVIRVKLSSNVIFDEKKLSRNFYMTSSCGVCGKTSIEAIAFSCLLQNNKPFVVKSDIILSLNEKIMAQQLLFKHTGGLHAAALFSKNGVFLSLYEDVGRHDAADKLFGKYFLENHLPLHEHILFLSGRTSYELMQKAAMAGVKVVCSVGAPSHLAILLAQKFNMILIGFLRKDYFNIYHGKEYITI